MSLFRRREIVFRGEMLVDEVRRAVLYGLRVSNLFFFSGRGAANPAPGKSRAFNFAN
jgi:hypothetical protein